MGLGALIAMMLFWQDCFGGLTARCFAATQGELGWALPASVWAVCLPTAVVAAFLVSPRPALALIGVAALLMVNPLTDRGLPFVLWDVADTLPFTGVATALAVLASGALLGASAARSTHLVIEGVQRMPSTPLRETGF